MIKNKNNNYAGIFLVRGFVSSWLFFKPADICNETEIAESWLNTAFTPTLY